MLLSIATYSSLPLHLSQENVAKHSGDEESKYSDILFITYSSVAEYSGIEEYVAKCSGIEEYTTILSDT